MNLSQRKLKFFFYCLLTVPVSLAYIPATRKPPTSLKEIDIDDVLLQTEQALAAAHESLSTSASESIDEEWRNKAEVQYQIDRSILEVRKKPSMQDLSRVPEVMVATANEHLEELKASPTKLITKAQHDLEDWRRHVNHELRSAPKLLEDTFKKTMTSDNLKKASMSVFSAIADTAKAKQKRSQIDLSKRDIDISDVISEAEAALELAGIVDTSLESSKTKQEQKGKAKHENIFQNIQNQAKATIMNTKKSEMIDISNRDIDISDVLAEAEAALMAAESSEKSMKTSSIEKAKQKWIQILVFIHAQNDQLSPIRKTNRENLIYTLSQYVVMMQEIFLITCKKIAEENLRLSPIRKENRAIILSNLIEFAIFNREMFFSVCKSIAEENKRLSPIRKINRACLAHTLVQFAVLQKDLFLMSCKKVAKENRRLSPIRKLNRAFLTHTLVEFAVLQQELFWMSCKKVAKENRRLSPIRKENRAILFHNMVEFLILSKHFLNEGHSNVIKSWTNVLLYLKIQNERRKPICALNRTILAQNWHEYLVVQHEVLHFSWTKIKQTWDQILKRIEKSTGITDTSRENVLGLN